MYGAKEMKGVHGADKMKGVDGADEMKGAYGELEMALRALLRRLIEAQAGAIWINCTRRIWKI